MLVPLSPRPTLVALLAILLSFGVATSNVSAWQPKSDAVRDGRKSLELDSKQVTESSGLAFSQRDNDCLWTHNDSGGKARLYAFDEKGKPCGQVTLDDVDARDWEDIASYHDEVPRLLVADVGDNQTKRNSVSLYLFDEPNPNKKTKQKSFQHLSVRYADGARNCEAVAVDVRRRKILLLSKTMLLATVHQVDLPKRIPDQDGAEVSVTTATAFPVCRIAVPMATGMDICRQSGDLWVCSYFIAYGYPGDATKSLAEIFKAVPRSMDLPKLKQVEAIAVDDRSRVWVTSEGKPTKLRRLVEQDGE